MVVVDLSELDNLGERLISAVTDVGSSALPITVRTELAEMFAERELLFPGPDGRYRVHTPRGQVGWPFVGNRRDEDLHVRSTCER